MMVLQKISNRHEPSFRRMPESIRLRGLWTPAPDPDPGLAGVTGSGTFYDLGKA
jgi:hypothetical protein